MDCTRRNKQFPGLELWPISGHFKSALNATEHNSQFTGPEPPQLTRRKLAANRPAATRRIIRRIASGRWDALSIVTLLEPAYRKQAGCIFRQHKSCKPAHAARFQTRSEYPGTDGPFPATSIEQWNFSMPCWERRDFSRSVSESSRRRSFPRGSG